MCVCVSEDTLMRTLVPRFTYVRYEVDSSQIWKHLVSPGCVCGDAYKRLSLVISSLDNGSDFNCPMKEIVSNIDMFVLMLFLIRVYPVLFWLSSFIRFYRYLSGCIQFYRYFIVGQRVAILLPSQRDVSLYCFFLANENLILHYTVELYHIHPAGKQSSVNRQKKLLKL